MTTLVEAKGEALVTHRVDAENVEAVIAQVYLERSEARPHNPSEGQSSTPEEIRARRWAKVFNQSRCEPFLLRPSRPREVTFVGLAQGKNWFARGSNALRDRFRLHNWGQVFDHPSCLGWHPNDSPRPSPAVIIGEPYGLGELPQLIQALTEAGLMDSLIVEASAYSCYYRGRTFSVQMWNQTAFIGDPRPFSSPQESSYVTSLLWEGI